MSSLTTSTTQSQLAIRARSQLLLKVVTRIDRLFKRRGLLDDNGSDGRAGKCPRRVTAQVD